jgi:hypothetical protein
MPKTFCGLDYDMWVRAARATLVLEERGQRLTPAELEALPDGHGPLYRQLGKIKLFQVRDLLEWGRQEQLRSKPDGAPVIHIHLHLPDPAASRRSRRRQATEPAAA